MRKQPFLSSAARKRRDSATVILHTPYPRYVGTLDSKGDEITSSGPMRWSYLLSPAFLELLIEVNEGRMTCH